MRLADLGRWRQFPDFDIPPSNAAFRGAYFLLIACGKCSTPLVVLVTCAFLIYNNVTPIEIVSDKPLKYFVLSVDEVTLILTAIASASSDITTAAIARRRIAMPVLRPFHGLRCRLTARPRRRST